MNRAGLRLPNLIMKMLRVVALTTALVSLGAIAGQQPSSVDSGARGALVRQAQERLMSEGFDPGPVDGQLGAETRKGLKNFQESRRLEQSGELDSSTIAALGLSLLERNDAGPAALGVVEGKRGDARAPVTGPHQAADLDLRRDESQAEPLAERR